jgi:tetratricopeptide (TPR) repeat protein
MKIKITVAAVFLLSIHSQNLFAQTNNQWTRRNSNNISAAKNIETLLNGQNNFARQEGLPQQNEISRGRRALAYAKLLEGQRHLWRLNRLRSKAVNSGVARLAKDALQKAVELDPTLAEGYAALAELTAQTPPNDLDGAILLANIAVKINTDNYGGHRLLARLYTIKSNLNRADLDAEFTRKAIAEWKEIARLDARNAEAFAFLSEFYEKTNKTAERIDALRRWISASAPLEPGFYRTFFVGQEELIPENATIKLGGALLDAGEMSEAVEILSRAVADNPENAQSMELLREAIENADARSSAIAVQALTQAVFANPENVSLVALLAQTKARGGQTDEAAKILRAATAKLAEKDKNAAAYLQVVLGDIYAEQERFAEAIAGYENALTARGIDGAIVAQDDGQDFAVRVFEKIIQTFKRSERPNDAKAVIERARSLFGKTNSFPDKQLILLYRESGKTADALRAVRQLRARNGEDFGLLRTEALILTDAGRVDEAVALVKPLIGKNNAVKAKSGGTVKADENAFVISSPMFDDFTNYLFISSLYSQARHGREAIEAAKQAISAAGASEERSQIARLALATAQQTAGDFTAAETTLRELLRQTPGNPVALNNLGYFLVERNTKLDEALSLIVQAVKIDRSNPSYLDSLGWAYFKLGRLEQAEKYLKEAVRLDASSATVQEHLGDVFQKQGKIEQAISSWQKSLTLTTEAEQTARVKSKLKATK